MRFNVICDKLKKIIPSELKYDYLHLKNKNKFEKEIRKKEVREGEKRNYKYTLKSFKRKRCIFIHIPRAAGSSISEAVFNNSGGGHSTAERYRVVFGRKFWNYYKFTFVRNPYTRLLSGYKYLKNRGHTAWPNNKKFKKETIESYNGFSNFVLNWLRENRSEWPVPHFRPQVDFLEVDSRIPVDFIGSVEKIKEDFEVLANEVNCEESLQKKNESPESKKPAKSYYKREDVTRRVKKVYKKDFEKLGYSKKKSDMKEEPKIRRYRKNR